MKFVNVKALRWASFISYVAGGGCAAVFFFNRHDPASISAALIALAGAIRSLLPAQAIDRDAPVVSNNGVVTAMNVSTDSTHPIIAPFDPQRAGNTPAAK